MSILPRAVVLHGEIAGGDDPTALSERERSLGKSQVFDGSGRDPDSRV